MLFQITHAQNFQLDVALTGYERTITDHPNMAFLRCCLRDPSTGCNTPGPCAEEESQSASLDNDVSREDPLTFVRASVRTQF